MGVFFLLGAVEEGVAHDDVCPSAEFAAVGFEGMGFAKCAGEGFLQEVVGAVLFVCETVGVSPKLALQCKKQLFGVFSFHCVWRVS